MAFKMSGVSLHQPTPRAGEPKPWLPPSGGGTGLLGPTQRRSLSSENLKPAAGVDSNRA